MPQIVYAEMELKPLSRASAATPCNAGIVDEDVEWLAARTCDEVLGARPHGGEVREVELQHLAARASTQRDLLSHPACFLGRSARHPHHASAPRQLKRGGAPDAGV